MNCPSCGHSNDRVLDTREQKDGQSIRRRRECLHCRTRFSTLEELSLSLPFVIKKDGRREPFSREKLLKGIQAACQKRPVGLAQLESMVDRISLWITGLGDREVPTQKLGGRVMRELRSLDHVAYVRFASVYRTFTDIQEFVDGLEEEPQPMTEPAQLSFESPPALTFESPSASTFDNQRTLTFDERTNRDETSSPRTCAADSLPS